MRLQEWLQILLPAFPLAQEQADHNVGAAARDFFKVTKSGKNLPCSWHPLLSPLYSMAPFPSLPLVSSSFSLLISPGAGRGDLSAVTTFPTSLAILQLRLQGTAAWEARLSQARWCVFPLPAAVPRLAGNIWGDGAGRGNPPTAAILS